MRVLDKGTIKMLTETQKAKLVEATIERVVEAREYFDSFNIRDVMVSFNLRGSVAGQYHARDNLIKYNPAIAANNFKQFKQRTVPHEVAHHVVREITIGRRKVVKPHGVEWRTVMQMFGVKNMDRCHSYDMTGVKVARQRRVNYRCSCNTHELSMTIHNRIRRGAIYKCRICDDVLHIL